MQSASDKPRLVEIEIRFNPKLILEYMTSRHGFWRHLSWLFMTLFWLSAAFGLQLALPSNFPAYPWFPAAWGTAYLATRRGSACAICCAFAIGLAIDAISFNPLGPSSIILTLVALACRQISTIIPQKTYFRTNTLFLSIASTGIYVIGKVFFCRPRATLETDFALLPKYLFGGILLAIPACFFTFSIKDMLEDFLLASAETPKPPAEK